MSLLPARFQPEAFAPLGLASIPKTAPCIEAFRERCRHTDRLLSFERINHGDADDGCRQEFTFERAVEAAAQSVFDVGGYDV